MSSHTSKDLCHLGIVSAVCYEIRLIEVINEIVRVDPRQKVTCGEAVLAMILNCLGFVDRPLYLFTEFMKTKPVGILIRKDLTSDDFNDDTLGRALDKLFKAGLGTIFIQIAANAYKPASRYLHNCSMYFPIRIHEAVEFHAGAPGSSENWSVRRGN